MFPLVWNCVVVAGNDTERQMRLCSLLISAVNKPPANRILMLYSNINLTQVIHKMTLKHGKMKINSAESNEVITIYSASICS